MSKKTTLYFPDWLHKKVKMKSVKENKPMTELITKALKKYYNLEEDNPA